MVTTPLATYQDFNNSAYSNMAANISTTELQRIMNAATRACEAATKTRLAVFTTTENTRLQDTDIEDMLPAGITLPAQAQIGVDYARSLNVPALVRSFSVRNYPRLYPENWTGSISAVSLHWPAQVAPLTISTNAIYYQADIGEAYFNLGTFTPPGAIAQVTYSGGYTTVPEDLLQACLHMAASILGRMLDPIDGLHDPNLLRREAVELLVSYGATKPKSGV